MPGGGITDLQLKELRPAALALKLKLEEIETQPDAKGLESAFQTAKQKQVNAIMTTAGAAFFAERKRIDELPSNTACRLFIPPRWQCAFHLTETAGSNKRHCARRSTRQMRSRLDDSACFPMCDALLGWWRLRRRPATRKPGPR